MNDLILTDTHLASNDNTFFYTLIEFGLYMYVYVLPLKLLFFADVTNYQKFK